MVALPINPPEALHLLKERCRNLESQCAAYIRSLEAARTICRTQSIKEENR
jgi:hypothetical protein